MKKNAWMKVLYAFIAVASLVINFAVSGAVIALVDFLGLWSYPVIFFTGLGLVAFVLVVMVPPRKKGALNLFPSLHAKMEAQHERRMAKGFWKWVNGRGPLVLVLATTVLLGPFVGALVARFLGLDERRAWTYLVIANGASVGFWVSVYMGALEWLRVYFARIT